MVNWNTGNVRVHALGAPSFIPLPETEPHTLVQASSRWIMTASRARTRLLDLNVASVHAALTPLHIYPADAFHATPTFSLSPLPLAEAICAKAQADDVLRKTLMHHEFFLTAMQLEQGTHAVRLCMCYSPGLVAILALDDEGQVHVEHLFLVHATVSSATFQTKMLVACTDDARMHIWRVTSKDATRLKTFQGACTHPASLALHRIPHASLETYQLSLLYTTSVCGTWRVMLQEFVLRAHSSHVDCTSRCASGAPYRANTGAIQRGAAPRVVYEHPYLVVCTDRLDVYKVHGASRSLRTLPSVGRAASATCETLRIAHCGALDGHTSRIASVALDKGRCISTSVDGAVLIWNIRNRMEPITTLRAAAHDGVLPSLLPHPIPCHSMGALVRELSAEVPTKRGVVHWISCAFDKIFCIATTMAPRRTYEQVQVWQFY
ncbi:hypothetical protein MVES_000492 [Malassezia vespertilionis]|uniref:Uncharacterized protein n=1 Tax=Malassezia vespertilionis TaxID=2020962 RepID=A0A2N1JGG2_9BASI|nr:hypothetical protein MVES_000492 [Malassezia vespertilionis]